MWIFAGAIVLLLIIPNLTSPGSSSPPRVEPPKPLPPLPPLPNPKNSEEAKWRRLLYATDAKWRRMMYMMHMQKGSQPAPPPVQINIVTPNAMLEQAGREGLIPSQISQANANPADSNATVIEHGESQNAAPPASEPPAPAASAPSAAPPARKKKFQFPRPKLAVPHPRVAAQRGPENPEKNETQ
jgi:hypothetical protein